MRVLVIQSHRSPLPVPWIERCVDSVRAWAHDRKFDYRWSGDEIFEPLSVKLRHKTRHRKAVASDLARLYALRAALAEGYQQAVWVDADVLVFDPDALTLPDTDHAFGRENWVQLTDSGKPRIYRRIHNAFMSFSAESSFLDFYLYSAERILTRHKDQMVPQLIGPKFLTALHNIVEFPVIENVGMLSPLVVRDLLAGGQGAGLAKFLNSSSPLAAANLCASMVAKGELSSDEIARVVELLLDKPALLS